MNYKMEIRDISESISVQRHALKLGYTFYGSKARRNPLGTPRWTNKRYLLFEASLINTYGNGPRHYQESNCVEITPEQFLTLTEVGGEINMKTDKTEKLKRDIEEMKNKLNSMESTLDEMEKKQKDSGWYNGGYGFGINCRGEVYPTNNPDKIDKADNLFSSEEKAERIAGEQNLWRKIRRFADENNDEPEKSRYYLYQHASLIGNIILIGEYDRGVRDFGGIYFSSENIAQKALNLHKEDLIKYFKGRN